MQSLPPKLLLTLLVLLNIINIIDRNLISSFGPQIIQELQLSDAQFGLLTGLMFVLFYATMGLFMGALADRYNRTRLIATGLFIWSLLTFYSGMAKNFIQIGLARLVIGIGESVLTPSSMSLLSDVFPSNQRGKMAGIYYLGVPLGAGGSFLLAGILGEHIGWRNCFYLLGVIGIFLSMILLMVKEPPRGAVEHNKPEQDNLPLRDAIKRLWRLFVEKPALKYSILGALFVHIPLGTGQFTIIWLVRERGFEAQDITIIYGLLFVLFGTIGVLLGGFLSDWYQKRFQGGRPKFLVIFMLMLTPLIITYRYVSPDNILFYIGMSAGFVNVMALYGPVYATVQDLTPAKLRGSMTAILLLACNMVGLGLGAWGAGLLSVWFTQLGFSQSLTISLIVGDAISAVAVVCFFLAAKYLPKVDR